MAATSKDFSSKVVLVTGSSSGIGQAIAIHLCSLRANVVITGRNAERLRAAAERCRQASEGKAEVLSVVADVSKEEDLQRLVDETINKFGRLDVLVNNAGIFQMRPLLSSDFLFQYDQIMNTNVRSVVQLTRLAMPHLVKVKGNVVNVSSVASKKPNALSSIYSMSKSALDMFTQCTAMEFGPSGVRVNAINPAAIDTPIFDKLDVGNISTQTMNGLVSKVYPLGRIGQPEECAKAVAFLASEDASFTTGVTLLVDGGSLHTQLVLPKN